MVNPNEIALDVEDNANYGYGGVGNDQVFGTAGKDQLWGDDKTVNQLMGGDDLLRGYGGEDIIFGQEGDDVLYGDEAIDVLIGGWGDDKVFGGDDDDVIWGDDKVRDATADVDGTAEHMGEQAGKDKLYGEGGEVFFGALGRRSCRADVLRWCVAALLDK